MTEYDLTEIPIKSSAKIFRFLNYFLEKKNLDPKYFENNLDRFSEEELFFLFKYASKYFEYKEGGFLFNWVKEIDYLYGFEDSKDYLAEIISNANQLITIVTDREIVKFIEKEYLHFRKSKADYFKFNFSNPIPQNIQVETNSYPIQSYRRIPLYVEQERFNNFKEEFFKNFEICLDKQFIENLFNNTFDYPNNPQKLQFLYLDTTKQSALNEAFMIVCKLYKEKILSRYSNKKQLDRDKSIEKINKQIVEKVTEKTEGKDSYSLDRAKILLKQLAIPKKVDRIHFMIAMYNSFPEIRKSYKNSKHKNLNEFFTQRIKNIKKA